ncbi:glycosyltransferase [Pseudanabaena sp. FACHB-2040]|uniref:glycosyltransferase family 2 protein n=1 Tax=Pseudanabaena sp. FACHB-2040 TaxID=2692859 RepID=UPI0016849557|nr:glycosyltransferase [Pseudanabaena sp. FACHB-2040]MBD2260572.1 glycosyltransferase [Pseudanabaena sp. FACHB-2040]
MSVPTVSVLMPVYNGSDYLQESIDSILNQTYSDFEFVIIDDCSTDNTWEILNFNAQRDHRIKLLQNPENLGLIKTLNKGIKAAQGKYIARQDADDISLPERLEREVEVLDRQPDCILVSSNIQVIKGSNKKIIEIMRKACKPELLPWYLLFYNRIGGHSQVMYRQDVVVAMGGYSEVRPHVEDYELWCRFSRTGKMMVIIPEIFLTYRRHGQSISAKKSKEQESNRYKQVKENIDHLTEKDISIEEAKTLMGFWKGNRESIFEVWHHRFPSASQVEFVHESLTELKKCFVEKYQDLFPTVNLSDELNHLIGEQFLFWLRSPLTKDHNIASKIKITPYVLLWNPNILVVVVNWLLWLLRFPIDSLISLYRKAFAKGISQDL